MFTAAFASAITFAWQRHSCSHDKAAIFAAAHESGVGISLYFAAMPNPVVVWRSRASTAICEYSLISLRKCLSWCPSTGDGPTRGCAHFSNAWGEKPKRSRRRLLRGVDKPADGMNARPIMTLACPSRRSGDAAATYPLFEASTARSARKWHPDTKALVPRNCRKPSIGFPAKADVQKSSNRGLFT